MPPPTQLPWVSVTIPTPPPLRAGRLVRELAGLSAGIGLLLRAPSLARQPRGGGAPVLVVPGFGAGDGSTALLRGFLGLLGYRVRGWGLGPTAATSAPSSRASPSW
jgi:hypothetical protein